MATVRGLILVLANLVSALLPQTRGFGVRRALFRAAGVTVADGAKIVGLTRIYYPNAHIGESWIGAGTHISCTPAARVTIGDRCDIAPGVLFVTGSHELGDSTRRAGKGFSKPINVGSGTWVGARATFLGGSSVGEGCVVAAGALVRDEFPANVMIAGIPARIVRHLSD
jgi:maltose O-acetyltransferase